MKINKLKINAYGKIKDKEIDLKNGVNIIYGENESGKSTLLKFISNMLFGISKNKNGKEYSDFEKYKPWNAEEFSGKIDYELDNEKKFEVFRDFKKKSPQIINENKEDITKEFSIDKIKGNQFFYEQTKMDETLFLSTILINQAEVRLEKNDQNQYIAKVEKDELLEEVNSATGTISGSLSVSMRKQGVPGKIIAKFSNLFGAAVDFRRDVKNGDKFEVIYENHITPSGEIVKTGNIIYAGLILRKDKLELFRFTDSKGNVDYYNEKGLAMKRTLHRKPLAFQRARISSPFGKRRHPILKRVIIHWGVDYAAPKGTAIYAGGDGVVQVAKYNGGYGNYIKIRHNSEYSTAYGHMQKFAKGIRPGVRVKQGQVIGYVGSTGRSTGPHLHYEVVKNGRRVNPLKIKAAAGENLKGNNLKRFKSQVAELKKTYNTMFAQNEPAKVAKK